MYDDNNVDDELINYSINLYNPTSKFLYDNVNNNNPLNDEEYDHEDDNINHNKP